VGKVKQLLNLLSEKLSNTDRKKLELIMNKLLQKNSSSKDMKGLLELYFDNTNNVDLSSLSDADLEELYGQMQSFGLQ